MRASSWAPRLLLTNESVNALNLGGLRKSQAIRARRDILVQGKVMVVQGMKGTVEGPSHRHPLERVNVLFAQRRDGKLRTINVLPDEIEPVKGA